MTVRALTSGGSASDRTPWEKELLHRIINGLALPVKRYVLKYGSALAVQDLNDSDRYPALVMGLVVALWR